MLNSINLQGRLTKDPELRHTEQGMAVAALTLAVERDSKDKDADFINCVSFNKTAEFISRYFHKGDMAIVSGRLQSRKWKDKDGNSRINWDVIVNNVNFGGGKREDKAVNVSTDNQWSDIENVDGGDLPF